MTGCSLPPSGIGRVVRGLVQAGEVGAKKALWTISSTEILCARMHSWQSALGCYVFFFFCKRHLPIADKGTNLNTTITLGVLRSSANSEFNPARSQVHGEKSL
ncbi:putative protein kinase-like protein [Trypanosoma rangeli]|uniref:Uncharacterized protein n=1 Tax=Trypanosoma rangeli TaxID=5698 RepID=A0A422MWK2_TRYRA|nr:putative protein kinase-like protein [Trypanosoma rangeli]RNE97608.1 putative protein kinase-like protein [Trypanosoma rangeli]|eukprot:RNE97608.1 putative protein kinase-like protein [Trypanosoma rangeli]